MCMCVAVPTDDGRNSYVFNGARTTKSTRTITLDDDEERAAGTHPNVLVESAVQAGSGRHTEVGSEEGGVGEVGGSREVGDSEEKQKKEEEEETSSRCAGFGPAWAVSGDISIKSSHTAQCKHSGSFLIRDGVHPCSQHTSVGLNIGEIRACRVAGACVDVLCDEAGGRPCLETRRSMEC